MAISATTNFECRPDGNDNNGGGFNSAGSGAGTDYSQQASAQLTVTDAVANGTTTVTSATGGFTSAHARNIAHIGTGWYEIVSVTDTNTIVVDRTITAASGLTLIIGGAFATPGGFVGAKVSGTNVGVLFIKNTGVAGSPSIYTISGGTANTSGNRVNENSTTMYVGYATNRSIYNSDERPIIRAGANSITLFTVGIARPASTINLVFDNPNSYTSVTALNASFSSVRNCKIDMNSASGCKGITGGGGGNTVRDTSIWNCTAGASAYTGIHIRVAAINCSGGSAVFYNGIDYDQCIAYNCSHSTYIFFSNTNGSTFRHCAVYNCTGATTTTGFTLNTGNVAEYCVVYSTSGYGFNFNGTANTNTATRIVNCACGNATTANYATTYADSSQIENFVTLSGDPFNNASGKDFSLNSTYGATIKGIAKTFPDISTTAYTDIGAVQHNASILPAHYFSS